MEPLIDWLGPEYPRDNTFTARMRAHQSWYRAFVLAEPCGVGPYAGSENKYGNYLSPEAAEQGRNFLTEHIWEGVQERLAEGGGVQRYRCLHNLLSSQPMCFNLLGQLRTHTSLATKLFRALLPDEVEEVEGVVIEWAPSPKERYLDDATSFDAIVCYRRAFDGARAFLAIETKLTEPFSRKHYGFDHRPAYRRISERRGGPWKSDRIDDLPTTAWNQLWRNHMLAVSLVEDDQSDFAHGIPVVVVHPEDVRGLDVVGGYQDLLENPDSIRVFNLREIVDAWRPLVEEGSDRRWLDVFAARYLDLFLSDAFASRERESS